MITLEVSEALTLLFALHNHPRNCSWKHWAVTKLEELQTSQASQTSIPGMFFRASFLRLLRPWKPLYHSKPANRASTRLAWQQSCGAPYGRAAKMTQEQRLLRPRKPPRANQQGEGVLLWLSLTWFIGFAASISLTYLKTWA